MVDTDLKAANIAGAAAAFAIWPVLRRVPGCFAILSFVLVMPVVLLRLAPFDFQPTGRDFSWVPFNSKMHGSIGIAVQALLEKSYLYGGVIWVLMRAGLSLRSATTPVAMLLLTTGYAETWLPGRSAEITDAMITLAAGGGFYLFPDRNADRGFVRSRAF